MLSWSIVAITIASVVTLGSAASTKVVYSVGIDKILHCLAFAWVVLISFGAVKNLTVRTGLIAVAWVTGFGVAIELIQYPIPYRTFNPIDIFANACGAVFGSLVFASWRLCARTNRGIEERRSADYTDYAD